MYPGTRPRIGGKGENVRGCKSWCKFSPEIQLLVPLVSPKTFQVVRVKFKLGRAWREVGADKNINKRIPAFPRCSFKYHFNLCRSGLLLKRISYTIYCILETYFSFRLILTTIMTLISLCINCVCFCFPLSATWCTYRKAQRSFWFFVVS